MTPETEPAAEPEAPQHRTWKDDGKVRLRTIICDVCTIRCYQDGQCPSCRQVMAR